MPFISAATLAGVPDWVRQTFGERVLAKATHAAVLDFELVEQQDCFIPQLAMSRFLHAVEHHGAAPDMGLMLFPHLRFDTYGLWADYVVSAPTLGAALRRVSSTLGYHSIGDRAGLVVRRGTAQLRYYNALRGQPGYAQVAIGTAGVLLDLLRCDLGRTWLPARLCLDIPRPRSSVAFEDVIGCPVVFESSAVALVFDPTLLRSRRPARTDPGLLTFGDLTRLRFAPDHFEDFEGVVVSQIWTHLLAGTPTIDATAHALGKSTRTLQRDLNRAGTDFRRLLGDVRMQRARELLRESTAPVTEIAQELHYSSAANFARAFRRSTGVGPLQFRQTSSPCPYAPGR